MSFFTEIKTICKAIKPTAQVLHFSEVKNEEESQNYDTFPVVIMTEDMQENNTPTKGGRILTKAVYNFLFKTADEWDNRQYDNAGTQVEKTSEELYEEMKTYANSVFMYFSIHNIVVLSPTQKITWQIFPALRDGINTMTGCKVRVSFDYFPDYGCLPIQ